MHPEIKQDKPGNCPKCGMKLVKKGSKMKHIMHHEEKTFFQTYKPLFIIIGLILLPVITISIAQNLSLKESMRLFMGGFFLVFSGFKLLDVSGFAEGYSTYDLLAKRVYSYGFIYPFIELLLGLAYIANIQMQLINIITLILMIFSGIGVAISLSKKQKFQCSCLGTIINVPLGKVTLVEDFGMAIMAAIMLL